MSKSKLLLGTLLCLGLLFIIPTISSAFEQPHSSYWFPEDLMQWSPETDPDAVYNRSQVPLAERNTLYAVNDTAQSEAKLVALSALNQQTSGVPSQGSKDFYSNTFGYWQYVDIMVYWAGSSGEGIIVPPSADVIDASHKNGVPILGTVFFPPEVFGGQFAWIEQMLEQEADGSFPVADKLIEVAQYYGFDGWFFNQETNGGTKETAQKMQDFLVYIQEKKPEGMHIMWYDSMTRDGNISWQNYLTDANSFFVQDGEKRVSDSMFLNFWWSNQQQSYNKANEISRSPYDLFAGIDTEAAGTSTNVPWNGLFPSGKAPYASLGIYRPDWTYKTSDTMEQFYQKEQDFWVGLDGDPANTEDPGRWKGMANYFIGKTVINKYPFVTHFNTGSGNLFTVDGEVMSEQSWNNRSLQDILPTWRWTVEGGQLLTPEFDWETAYYGGSSLKISGMVDADEPTNIKLYKTNLTVDKDTELSITYQTNTNEADMKVGISLLDDPDQFIYLHKEDDEDEDDSMEEEWVTQVLKLEKYEGKQIAAISLYFESEEDVQDYTMSIGEMKLYNKKEKLNLDQPELFQVKDSSFENAVFADVSLTWNAVTDADHYEIYRIMADGSKEFIGATPNQIFFVSEMRRDGKETETSFEIVAIGSNFEKSEDAGVKMEWPSYPVPVANFTVDKTVIGPGEEIQFFNTSSSVTESLYWEFEGGMPATSTEENPIVTFANEGLYTVTLTAINSEGENVITKEDLIFVTKGAENMTNVALNKFVEADDACAASEAAVFAVDGTVTNKWCALGDAPHWLKVDLGVEYSIAKFVTKHAEAGGEGAAYNTKAYSIEVSTDGESWTTVTEVMENTKAISEDSIALTSARYVRLWVNQPTQGGDQAARIYEFEVYGFPAQ
ncbi:endo-beta-N-acetylglucosaminidase [Chengkuizengella sediminis]|uniref:endo-beta-N-acetylglucosaminidase n=1 Tax=Chengkuizengella sediminis TaxID=1885917 RepID=UPI00138A0245|nr:discoidin domain-containing protein [Chengkuizengella sediminis]NDI35929.1 PKD domain-containing protein [Chengkuizengella sediminis]